MGFDPVHEHENEEAFRRLHPSREHNYPVGVYPFKVVYKRVDRAGQVYGVQSLMYCKDREHAAMWAARLEEVEPSQHGSVVDVRIVDRRI